MDKKCYERFGYVGMRKLALKLLLLFLTIYMLISEVLKIKVIKTADIVGPRIIPLLIVSCICILSCTIIFKNKQYNDRSFANNTKDRSIIVYIGILSVYVLTLKYLGFILATIIFLLIFEIQIGFFSQKKYILSVLYVVILPICLWFIFDVLLGMNLPKGQIFI